MAADSRLIKWSICNWPEPATSSSLLPRKRRNCNGFLKVCGGAEVLTVGDTKGFAELGGIINFVLDNDRVRFEVNRKAAEQAGLKISSKLLIVAKLVIG